MASLAKWLSVRLRTKWFWVRVQLQMLHRLPIALTQIKAGNRSENILNEILQIINYFYRAKGITKNYIII